MGMQLDEEINKEWLIKDRRFKETWKKSVFYASLNFF